MTPAGAAYGRYALLACLPVIAIVVLLVLGIVVALARR